MPVDNNQSQLHSTTVSLPIVQDQSQLHSPTVSVPIEDNYDIQAEQVGPTPLSTQDIINSHQNLIETQLNLTPSNADTHSSQQKDEIIPGVNAPIPIVLKKGPTKKPVKEKISLIRSLVPTQSPENVKNTLYFRNSVALAPLQQTNLLLLHNPYQINYIMLLFNLLLK